MISNSSFAIGIIGPIASGKSTIANLFSLYDVPVIKTDGLAREVTSANSDALKKIIERFGDTLLLPSGNLDRKALRAIMFNHPEHKLWLEALLHPLIREKIIDYQKTISSLYHLIEIPLVPNHNKYSYLNRILYVSAPKSLRISRLKIRDNYSSESDADFVINQQASDSEYQKIADDYIVNDDNHDTIKHQVIQIHAYYLQLAMDFLKKTHKYSESLN